MHKYTFVHGVEPEANAVVDEHGAAAVVFDVMSHLVKGLDIKHLESDRKRIKQGESFND